MLNFIPLQEQAQGGGFSGIIMIALLLVVFWLFMIRPQQKRQKEIKKFREGLGKGDKIVTAGGLYGTISEVRDNTFVIELTKGVNVTIDKGSVYPSAESTQDSPVQQQQQQSK